MEVWAWIVAYIVGFSLLQLLVYRYFRDREPSVEQTSPSRSESYAAQLDGTERQNAARSSDDEGTRCRQCGAFNERASTYRYCRQCVSPLQ